LRDDAAVLAPGDGRSFVVTVDTLVAGVHFLAGDPADLVARKALRVNLSDLAAKGADPAYYLVALSVGDGHGRDWIERFAAGLSEDQDIYGCRLAGGDTTRTPGPTVVTITALGNVPAGGMVQRAGARAGDLVYVTGVIGDGAFGLAVHRGDDSVAALAPDQRRELESRYLLPEPRCRLAAAVRSVASAAMDVSDGLVGDLTLLCEASGVSARVEIARVPFSAPVRRLLAMKPELVGIALTGGDDYEVIVCVPPARAERFEAMADDAGIAVTRIGEVTDDAGEPMFVDAEGRAMAFAKPSFSHFD